MTMTLRTSPSLTHASKSRSTPAHYGTFRTLRNFLMAASFPAARVAAVGHHTPLRSAEHFARRGCRPGRPDAAGTRLLRRHRAREDREALDVRPEQSRQDVQGPAPL